jgi:hypothetical protein
MIAAASPVIRVGGYRLRSLDVIAPVMKRKIRRESCTLPGHLPKPALIKVDPVMIDLFRPLAVDSCGPD